MLERSAREAARRSYFNRLINDSEAKKGILDKSGADANPDRA
jgi:hypothetical protein